MTEHNKLTMNFYVTLPVAFLAAEHQFVATKYYKWSL